MLVYRRFAARHPYRRPACLSVLKRTGRLAEERRPGPSGKPPAPHLAFRGMPAANGIPPSAVACSASSFLLLHFMIPSSPSDVVSLRFAYISASFPAEPPVSQLRLVHLRRRSCRPKAVFGAFWTSAAAGVRHDRRDLPARVLCFRNSPAALERASGRWGPKGEEAGSAPLGRLVRAWTRRGGSGPRCAGVTGPCDNARGWLFPAGWPDGALGLSKT